MTMTPPGINGVSSTEELILDKLIALGAHRSGLRPQGVTPWELAKFTPRRTASELKRQLKKMAGFRTVPVEKVNAGRYRISDISEANEYRKPDSVWWANEDSNDDD